MLDLASKASGDDQVHVVHKPRELSDKGSRSVSGDLAEWLQDKVRVPRDEALSRCPISPTNCTSLKAIPKK